MEKKDSIKMTERIYKFDNLKAILIFLVVFGHFLELVEGYELLYLVIYSFHMPLFLFLSGYFARFDKKKIMCQLICPYVIFQVLYTYFDISLFHAEKMALTFVRPRWLMWYLFDMILYYLLIPFLDLASRKKRLAAVAGMIIIALLSGYDNKLGYDFSSARIFTFMPFFFSGYYLSKETGRAMAVGTQTDRAYIGKLGGAVFGIAVMVGILDTGLISPQMLYGSYSYDAAEYDVLIRMLIFVMAGLWILIAMSVMPNRKIPFLSAMGRYTMPVFLLHGFVVKLIGRYYVENGEKLPFLEALFLSILVVILFGNKFVGNLFGKIFTGRWSGRGRWLCQGKS